MFGRRMEGRRRDGRVFSGRSAHDRGCGAASWLQPGCGRDMLRAVRAGHGGMAQFNHPEFGGSGQWMRGGMTMVWEHVRFRAQSPRRAPVRRAFADSRTRAADRRRGARGARRMVASELGVPNSAGSQNEMRYAYLPQRVGWPSTSAAASRSTIRSIIASAASHSNRPDTGRWPSPASTAWSISAGYRASHPNLRAQPSPVSGHRAQSSPEPGDPVQPSPGPGQPCSTIAAGGCSRAGNGARTRCRRHDREAGRTAPQGHPHRCRVFSEENRTARAALNDVERQTSDDRGLLGSAAAGCDARRGRSGGGRAGVRAGARASASHRGRRLRSRRAAAASIRSSRFWGPRWASEVRRIGGIPFVTTAMGSHGAPRTSGSARC